MSIFTVIIDRVIRAVNVVLYNSAGTEVGTATNKLYVDSSGSTTTVTGGATAANQTTEITKLTTLTNIDYATQATLEAARVLLNTINAKLVTGTDIGDVTINNAAGAAAVNIQDGGNAITVDGTVTANAGTNLNTSALALEAGGNLADIKTGIDVLNSLVPAVYDYISLTYTGANLTGVVYKTGGAGGSTVSTLTLAYSGSNLTSVTKT